MTKDDRLVSKKQLREIVLLSSTQIDRLESAGDFPKRIPLGPYRNSRVGWLLSEVLAWLQKRTEAGHAAS